MFWPLSAATTTLVLPPDLPIQLLVHCQNHFHLVNTRVIFHSSYYSFGHRPPATSVQKTAAIGACRPSDCLFASLRPWYDFTEINAYTDGLSELANPIILRARVKVGSLCLSSVTEKRDHPGIINLMQFLRDLSTPESSHLLNTQNATACT